MKSLFTVFFCLFLATFSQSQNIELGISGGLSGYFGDLDSPSLTRNLQNMKPTGGVFIRDNFNSRLSLRGSLMIGKFTGADSLSNRPWQQDRNLSFTSNFVEVAALFDFNFFKFDMIEGKRFTPYITGGIAYFHHNPKAEYDGNTYELQPLGTEGQGSPGFPEQYSLNLVTFPLGGGLKYKLSETITLQGEWLSRFTFNDYLDDVSGSYVNYFDLLVTNGPISAALSDPSVDFDPGRRQTGDQRGKADVDDYYYSATFSIIINLGELEGRGGGGQGCYEF